MSYFKHHSYMGVHVYVCLVLYHVNLFNENLTARITVLWALPTMYV